MDCPTSAPESLTPLLISEVGAGSNSCLAVYMRVKSAADDYARLTSDPLMDQNTSEASYGASACAVEAEPETILTGSLKECL